jgi:hypothetical protein
MNILNSPDVHSTERNDRSASFFPPTGVSLWSRSGRISRRREESKVLKRRAAAVLAGDDLVD